MFMNLTRTLVVLVAIATAVPPMVSAGAAFPQATELPRVHVVATGGTIAGRADAPANLAGYRSGAIPVEELLASVPGLDQVARVTGEQFSNVGSTGITPAQWVQMAQRINVILAEGVDGEPVAGVVVTHGTDALEETAYFLNLTVRSAKPVVMVGSMRPATAISADGPLNIFNGVQVAADADAGGRGVLVVLNQEINAARDVTKTNTLRADTFESRVWGALGTVDPDGVAFARRVEKRHTADSEFDISGLDPEALPRVDIVYSYNGNDGADVRGVLAAGTRGIVVAGSGGGGTARGQGEALREAADHGVFIVRGSRTGSGRVAFGRGNVIAADDLLVQKARILLMVALTQTQDVEQLQRIFREY